MRVVEVKSRARIAIDDLAEFIEIINMPGSSAKWVNKVYDFIGEIAQTPVRSFPLCYNKKLAAMGFSCRVYKRKWIIAFKYTDKKFIVYRFVLGSKLK